MAEIKKMRWRLSREVDDGIRVTLVVENCPNEVYHAIEDVLDKYRNLL